MEKIIVAVVTTVLCSMFSPEGPETSGTHSTKIDVTSSTKDDHHEKEDVGEELKLAPEKDSSF
jgi:hypothetical protein